MIWKGNLNQEKIVKKKTKKKLSVSSDKLYKIVVLLLLFVFVSALLFLVWIYQGF